MCGPHTQSIGANGANGSNAVNVKPPLQLQDCVNIFVFDFDDTLFPTSALVEHGPEALRSSFGQIDALIVELFETALRTPRSHAMLLTCANLEWVYHCAAEFLPRTNELLQGHAENMSLVSAHRSRSSGEWQEAALDPVAIASGKVEVAQSRAAGLQALIDACGAQTVQVVSIGDSPFDLQAGYALAGALRVEQAYVKTVAMKQRPQVGELVGELRALSRSLTPIARLSRSFHQTMRPTQQQLLLKAREASSGLAASSEAANVSGNATATQPTGVAAVADTISSNNIEGADPSRELPSLLGRTNNAARQQEGCDLLSVERSVKTTSLAA
jgi:hypothetical protein